MSLRTRRIPRLAVRLAQTYRLFYPQVPMIVASRFGKDIAAMPANSCIPVSDNPPLFAVSVRKGSKTDRILKRSKIFSVNWIGFRERKIISLLSESSKSANKLDAFKIPYQEISGAPVISAAKVYVICQKKSVQEVGDHDLIVGSVTGAMASIDFDENWKFEDYQPILYLGSNFRDPFSTIPHKRRPARI